MKMHNHLYQDQESLLTFVSDHDLAYQAGLVQVFAGDQDEAGVRTLLSRLNDLLPDFRMIGASTCGEIVDGSQSEGRILLSFSCFEATTVETGYTPDVSYESGQAWARRYRDSDARLVIIFGNGLRDNPEDFIKGFNAAAPGLCVAGGNAGDNNRFEHTFVIEADRLYDEGVVLAVLKSEALEVHSDCVLEWTPIGIPLEVTRAKGNVLYELNDQPVVEVYQYYLGEDVALDIPRTLMEFPLLRTQGDFLVARSPVGITDDGGLIFAGKLECGECVRFGVADVETITDGVRNTVNRISEQFPIEGVYTYSCTARRSFLASIISAEIATIGSLGPNAGFFTYGEYFHSGADCSLLNITTTLVTLSEKGEVSRRAGRELSVSIPRVSTLRSLTHLANATARDLTNSVQFLEQYKHALDQTAIVTRTDPAGRITYVNELFEIISGFPKDEVIGKTHQILRHPDMPASVFRDLWNTILNRQVWQGTLKNRKKNGDSYYVDTTIVPIVDHEGEIEEFISIRNDITEIILNQSKLAQQRTDKLTGLPSRARLIEDLERLQPLQLALVDVRSFKSFNDYYGIAMGDRILVELAAELEERCATYGIAVYRLHGAHFALLPDSSMSYESFCSHISELATRLQGKPLAVNNEYFDMDFFFGIGRGEDRLLTFAESALQKAKQDNITHKVVDLSEEDFDHTENIYWLNEIKEALQENRLTSFYQPIVSGSGGAVKDRYESLLRMIGRNGEVIPPLHFLDLAKQSRYYPQITKKVISDAISLASSRNLSISVNLSAKDMENPDISAFILQQLSLHGGHNLIFEITETESIQDYSKVKQFVEGVRARNSKIAIDDFGSGYSNYSYLIEIQPDFIKIDGSIISRILEDEKSRLITESIVEFAHKIDAKVVAEFVSSEDIADLLQEMKVDYFQGFHFGKPEVLPDLSD
ncbi:EAL domain-containing protein [Marinobacter sp.]|uniref:bifunctional diguanylate cyclase/phosphodiesterase n=1 Tax=Marinobacter sp. TaxID=50741 RepID=UPI0035644CE1